MPGQGCQVLMGRAQDACIACSLHNQCTTLMEATLSLSKFARQYGHMYVSPDGSEVSKLSWFDNLFRIVAFDALAPYHPTALGILTNLPKIDQANDTMRKKSTLHAFYRFAARMLGPKGEKLIQAPIIMNLGLQVFDNLNSTDMSTPEGIGNYVGNSVAAYAMKDGMNYRGDVNGKKYNLKPFSDYTGYNPVNSVNHISDPRQWQPDVVNSGPDGGQFSSQMFVTPQLAMVKPFSVSSVDSFCVQTPGRLGSWKQYMRDTDKVIASMAALTTKKKVMS